MTHAPAEPPADWRSVLGLARSLEDLRASELARALGVPTNRITAILNGQRRISADTALRLARHFGTTPELWLNLQDRYDLAATITDHGDEIERTVSRREQLAG